MDANDIIEKLKGEAISKNAYKIISGKHVMGLYKKLQAEYGDGLSTGYDSLDNFFKFLPQQLYLISAITHVGKTTLALNLAGRMARNGNNVLFASLEQGIFVAPRVQSLMRGEYPAKLALLTTEKMAQIDELSEAVRSLPTKPDIFFLDHIHFIKRRGLGGAQDVDEIVLELQNMAKQLKIPIVTICHVRKLNDNKAPTMDDLRDSSSLSQVPSVVMIIHRKVSEDGEESYLEQTGELIIAKNRIQGKTGKLKFNLFPTGQVGLL